MAVCLSWDGLNRSCYTPLRSLLDQSGPMIGISALRDARRIILVVALGLKRQ